MFYLFYFILLLSFRRYFGVIISHRQAAIFTARRSEMVDVMDHTLFYLNRSAMVCIYSPYSTVPRYVSFWLYLKDILVWSSMMSDPVVIE